MLQPFLSDESEAQATLISARIISKTPGFTDATYSVAVNGAVYDAITACLCKLLKIGFYAGVMYATCDEHGTREVRARRIYASSPSKGEVKSRRRKGASHDTRRTG